MSIGDLMKTVINEIVSLKKKNLDISRVRLTKNDPKGKALSDRRLSLKE